MSNQIEYLRSFRIGGVALFDLAGTMIIFGAAGKKLGYDWKVAALAGVAVSVPVHLLFGVETTFTRFVTDHRPKEIEPVPIPSAGGC